MRRAGGAGQQDHYDAPQEEQGQHAADELAEPAAGLSVRGEELDGERFFTFSLQHLRERFMQSADGQVDAQRPHSGHGEFLRLGQPGPLRARVEIVFGVG